MFSGAAFVNRGPVIAATMTAACYRHSCGSLPVETARGQAPRSGSAYSSSTDSWSCVHPPTLTMISEFSAEELSTRVGGGLVLQIRAVRHCSWISPSTVGLSSTKRHRLADPASARNFRLLYGCDRDGRTRFASTKTAVWCAQNGSAVWLSRSADRRRRPAAAVPPPRPGVKQLAPAAAASGVSLRRGTSARPSAALWIWLANDR